MKQQVKFMLLLMIVIITIPSTRTSGDDKPGKILLEKDITVVISKSISGTDGPIALPSGRYSIDSWIISRTDNNGSIWMCKGYISEDKRPFEVVAGHENELPIGEPIVSVLTANKRGPDIMFSQYLQGRLGERIQIERDGKRSQAPILRITNADGSYEKTSSFEYG